LLTFGLRSKAKDPVTESTKRPVTRRRSSTTPLVTQSSRPRRRRRSLPLSYERPRRTEWPDEREERRSSPTRSYKPLGSPFVSGFSCLLNCVFNDFSFGLDGILLPNLPAFWSVPYIPCHSRILMHSLNDTGSVRDDEIEIRMHAWVANFGKTSVGNRRRGGRSKDMPSDKLLVIETVGSSTVVDVEKREAREAIDGLSWSTYSDHERCSFLPHTVSSCKIA
jgi:hypothetical protein